MSGGKQYIIDGATCQCTLGSSPGILKVISQTLVRIQGKLKATHKDKLIMPTFGTCKKKTPCLPKLQDWQNTSISTTIGKDKKFILNDSFTMCAVGGKVTISNHGQVHNPISAVLPSGDCTVAQHRALQDAVDSQCDAGKRSCKGITDCVMLLENKNKNWNCAAARELINITCFKGGDKGHREAMDNALNAAAYCEQQYNKLCKPKSNPQPAPVPVDDKDFMKTMEELTGLRGRALIVYLIISEGSRLFPPRDLVPVP